jgi:hypothetical protein
MIDILIRFNFFILFIIYIILFIRLIKKGFDFNLGIIFGVLFFIFIPGLVFIFAGNVEISKMDFFNTNLVDIINTKYIRDSLILFTYLYALAGYIIINEFYIKKKPHTNRSIRSIEISSYWKIFFFTSLLLGLSIFMASGIQNGGNWFVNREIFFKEAGLLGLILTDTYAVFKLFFITSILYEYQKNKFNSFVFYIVVSVFSLIDIILTGNRIYVFILFAGIIILLIKKHGVKIIYSLLLLIPFGYAMSVYRHIRGNLFTEGIPSFDEIYNLIVKVVENNPPDISNFLLGISESVNFNVLYMIFDSININTALWGETFLKVFVFFIPRSMWIEKPLSITQVAGANFAPSAEHLSLVTTLIGETHMNFYLFGILFLPIILIITKTILEKLFTGNESDKIFLFLIGLLMFRMPYSDIFLVAIIAFFYYKTIIFLIKILSTKKYILKQYKINPIIQEKK